MLSPGWPESTTDRLTAIAVVGLDELSLPSMGSEDDDLYCDDIDDEPDIDDDYGEYLGRFYVE